MDDFTKIMLGAVLGAVLAYLPRFLSTRQKLIANRALLLVEIDACRKMAATYLSAGFASPAYRLPSLGWSQSIPQIIAIGMIDQTQIEAVQDFYAEVASLNWDFYAEVASLNRGLDQADRHMDDDRRLDAEAKRARVKSRNILDRYEKAKGAVEAISRWPIIS